VDDLIGASISHGFPFQAPCTYGYCANCQGCPLTSAHWHLLGSLLVLWHLFRLVHIGTVHLLRQTKAYQISVPVLATPNHMLWVLSALVLSTTVSLRTMPEFAKCITIKRRYYCEISTLSDSCLLLERSGKHTIRRTNRSGRGRIYCVIWCRCAFEGRAGSRSTVFT